jgi:hypothetical protein
MTLSSVFLQLDIFFRKLLEWKNPNIETIETIKIEELQ